MASYSIQSIKINIVVFLLACVVLIKALEGESVVSREENEELDQQLKLITRPTVKIIQKKDDDITDCVDAKQQLAFDHPMLKNHSLQQSPSSLLDENKEEGNAKFVLSEVFNSPICPTGTIPIRRTTREDLIRLKSFSKTGYKYLTLAPFPNHSLATGHHFAIQESIQSKYHGANAWVNFYSIPGLSRDQYSGTGITMLNGIGGPNDNFNVIMVGGMAHPGLYGDNQMRLTIFWTTDGYQKVQCYNHLCPGFVQISSKYELGSVIPHPGDSNYVPLSIYKDGRTGDWWFSISEPVGYWPKHIFSSLSDHATFIQVGGFVASPPARGGPPMGNGHFPEDGGARINKVEFIDEHNQPQYPVGIDHADRPGCYKITKLSFEGETGKWSFAYGGPGGCLG